MGRRRRRPPEGPLLPHPPRRRLLARAVEGRRGRRRPHHQHRFAVGPLRQRRPDQLRRRQGRHRGLDDGRGAGAGPLRRHRQLPRPDRGHPPGRAADGRRGEHPRGHQGGALAPLGRGRGHLAGQPRGPGGHRPDVRRPRRPARRRRGLAPRPRGHQPRHAPRAWARSSTTCSPRPGPTATSTARTTPPASRSPEATGRLADSPSSTASASSPARLWTTFGRLRPRRPGRRSVPLGQRAGVCFTRGIL